MPNPDDEPVAQRYPAASGRLAHGDPVVLRDSKQTRIELKPFYVPRSNGDVLAVKLTSQKKAPGGSGGGVGFPNEVNLEEAEIHTLHDALHRLLALTEEEDGSYVVVRLDDTGRNQARKLASLLSRPGIAARLAADDLDAEFAFAMSVPVRVQDLRSAVQKLRDLLEGGTTKEQSYQDWCEKYSWAFGNVYVARDEVRTIALGDQVDLLMKSSLNGLRDVYELKRPNMRVLGFDADHKSYYWSQNTSVAIGQCHRYLDGLHEGAARGLRDHPEITAYHPRAVVILGRSHEWTDERHRALHGLNARLHGIQVQTYDHLLAQAEATLALVRGEAVMRQ